MTTADFNADDADAVLAMLDRGALDAILTDAARARLRAAAEAAQVQGEADPPTLDEPPAAKVVAVQRDRRGVRTISVACPYCKPTRSGRPRLHFHGWADGNAEPGHRSAHCPEGRAAGRGYRVELGEFAS